MIDFVAFPPAYDRIAWEITSTIIGEKRNLRQTSTDETACQRSRKETERSLKLSFLTYVENYSASSSSATFLSQKTTVCNEISLCRRRNSLVYAGRYSKKYERQLRKWKWKICHPLINLKNADFSAKKQCFTVLVKGENNESSTSRRTKRKRNGK